MSESGEYTLRVACDRKGCDKRWSGGDNPRPMVTMFTALTRMDALAMARDAGWMLRHGNKALCPDHATEKRDQYRKPRV